MSLLNDHAMIFVRDTVPVLSVTAASRVVEAANLVAHKSIDLGLLVEGRIRDG